MFDQIRLMEQIVAMHRADGGAVMVATHQNMKLPDAVSLRLHSMETEHLSV